MEISQPLSVIQQLFEASKRGEGVFDPVAHFNSALDGRWAEVPLLNDTARAEQFPAGSLIRFRCMVQNVYNPEFYVAEYDLTNLQTGERVRANGRFADIVTALPGFTADLMGRTAVLDERQPVHCVSIPGESPWAKEALRGPGAPAAPATMSERNNKRAHEEGEEMDVEEVAGEGVKKIRQEAAGSSKPSAARPNVLKEGEHVAIVKIYDNSADFKVMEIMEIVGILTVDPILSEFGNADDEDAFLSGAPSSVSAAPRIHALCHRRLTPWCPATDAAPSAERQARAASAKARAPAARDAVIRRFAASLGGDAQAGEWALLAAISRVHKRVGAEKTPVGKFSVGFSGLPAGKGGGKGLAEAMGSVLPAVSYLPMSIQGFNKALMYPKKDNDTEQLSTGCLQLPASTRLVIDETCMSAGMFNDKGVKNLKAVEALITRQNVLIEFPFFPEPTPYPTDVPVLVTSQVKPLCPVDCIYHLGSHASPNVTPVAMCPDEEEACRLYMTMARSADVEIPPNVEEAITGYWINARQADKSMQPDDLHRFLTLTRLISASHLETVASGLRWAEVLEMEMARLASLPAQPDKGCAVGGRVMGFAEPPVSTTR